MTPLAPDWWRPTLLRAAVRYPGICEHPCTAEITVMGEARPHERCVACGADWYGPRFQKLRMIREDDLTGYVTGSGRARVTWVTALADPVDHDDFSTMKAEREQP